MPIRAFIIATNLIFPLISVSMCRIPGYNLQMVLGDRFLPFSDPLLLGSVKLFWEICNSTMPLLWTLAVISSHWEEAPAAPDWCLQEQRRRFRLSSTEPSQALLSGCNICQCEWSASWVRRKHPYKLCRLLSWAWQCENGIGRLKGGIPCFPIVSSRCEETTKPHQNNVLSHWETYSFFNIM